MCRAAAGGPLRQQARQRWDDEAVALIMSELTGERTVRKPQRYSQDEADAAPRVLVQAADAEHGTLSLNDAFRKASFPLMHRAMQSVMPSSLSLMDSCRRRASNILTPVHTHMPLCSGALPRSFSKAAGTAEGGIAPEGATSAGRS